jgi:polyhydroxyalkanoate synthesis regulator phasin
VKDLIKKALLLGIGLAAITEEKLREFVAELEKKGELSREEGKALVRELLAEREKQKKELQKRVAEEVEKALAKTGVASKKDVEKLSKKIEKLERTIAKLAGEK